MTRIGSAPDSGCPVDAARGVTGAVEAAGTDLATAVVEASTAAGGAGGATGAGKAGKAGTVGADAALRTRGQSGGRKTSASHGRAVSEPSRRRVPVPPRRAVSAPPRPLRFVALGDSLTAGIGDPVDGGEWRGWAALLGGALGPARPDRSASPGSGDQSGPTGPDRADLADLFDSRPDKHSRPDIHGRAKSPHRPDGSDRTDDVGGIADIRFRNVSVSGALTRDVEERQVPAALDFAPDLASVLVGVNDTLRRAFDIQDLAPRLDRICAALADSGAVLMTACLPDPGAVLGLPAPLARPLARRQRAVNAVVHALSARYDTVHLHMADASWVADRSLWSADRLHPCERGHRMIAARFHELLAARGLALGPSPSLEADQPPPTRTEALRWLAVSGTGWVVRRCQDLLPELLRLAGDEVQHWARGTGARLDLHADETLSRALAALSPRASVARMGE